MLEIVREWVERGDSDFKAAKLLAQQKGLENQAGFHCQQAIEKLLKALLQDNNIKFTKIHDLAELLRLSNSLFPDLDEIEEDLEWLTIFSVEFRYPGETALKEDAEQAFAIMKNSWEKIFSLL